MVIITDENRSEKASVKRANFTADTTKEFSLQVARRYWTEDMWFSHLVYVPGTEFGGIIGEILTDTHLDYIEMKGYTWRGFMAMKIIEPPAGENYLVVSGEANELLRSLISDRFGDLYVVPSKDTGVTIESFQFDRYCTLLEGIVKMLAGVGLRLHIEYKKTEQTAPGYVYVEAVPIVDYSAQIELSRDGDLHYTMDSKRNGVNHLVVAGKGELQDRTVFHLYVQEDGSIGDVQFYFGVDEVTVLYENTSTESSELRTNAEKKLKDLMDSDTFSMDVDRLNIDSVEVGDIVGGRDYLSGIYMKKPVEKITYSFVSGIVEKQYKLEGEK